MRYQWILLGALLASLLTACWDDNYYCAPLRYDPSVHRCVCDGVQLDSGLCILDAGPTDAGLDAEPTDGDSPDASPPDSGSCAPETCDGEDQDCDSVVDELACGASSVCVDRACVPVGSSADWTVHLHGAAAAVHSVVADGAGGVFVAGTFAEALDADGARIEAGSVERWLFVVGLGPEGAIRWSRAIEGTFTGRALLALASDGSVWLTAGVRGTARTPGATASAVGTASALVANLSSGGGVLRFDAVATGSGERTFEVLTAFDDGIVLGGRYTGVLMAGGLGYASDHPQGFVIALTGRLAQRWTRAFEGAGTSACRAIAVGGDGRLYLAGDVTSTVRFGSFPADTPDTQSSGVALALDADGMPMWLRTFTAEMGFVQLSALAVTSDQVVLAGTFLGRLDVGATPLLSRGRRDLALIGLEDDGAERWARHDGTSFVGDPVVMDANESVVAVAFSFDGAPRIADVDLASATGTNVGYAVYSSDGVPVGARSFPDSSGVGSVGAVVIASDRRVVVAGGFGGSLQVAPTTTLEGAPGADAFVSQSVGY